MKLKQRVFRSSVALSVGYAANKVIGIFIMLALARYLTPEEFGLYTLVFSWLVVLSIPTDIGFSQVLTREISRDEEGSAAVQLELEIIPSRVSHFGSVPAMA